MYKYLFTSIFSILLFSNIGGMQDSEILAAQEEKYDSKTVLTGFLSQFSVVIVEMRENKSGHKNYSGYTTKLGIGKEYNKKKLTRAQARKWSARMNPIATKYPSCRKHWLAKPITSNF